MSRKKLAPHLRWPISPTQLSVALEGLQAVDVAWRSWYKRATGDVVIATWRPTGRHTNDAMAVLVPEGAAVAIEPVPADQADTVRAAMPQVLADLRQWLEKAEAEGEGWKLLQHEKRWRIVGDAVEPLPEDAG